MVTALAWLAVCVGSAAPEASLARGHALFTGAEPLTGRIREHRESLPAAVVACGNCHAANGRAKVAGSDAPVLGTDVLTARRSRRNGPASAYDERSFCRVLRTGIDPVSILVDHTMPVYVLSDADCAGLWMFLSAGADKGKGVSP